MLKFGLTVSWAISFVGSMAPPKILVRWHPSKSNFLWVPLEWSTPERLSFRLGYSWDYKPLQSVLLSL